MHACGHLRRVEANDLATRNNDLAIKHKSLSLKFKGLAFILFTLIIATNLTYAQSQPIRHYEP